MPQDASARLPVPPAGPSLADDGGFLTLAEASISVESAQSAAPPPRVRARWRAGVSGNDTTPRHLQSQVAVTIACGSSRSQVEMTAVQRRSRPGVVRAM